MIEINWEAAGAAGESFPESNEVAERLPVALVRPVNLTGELPVIHRLRG